MVDCMTDNRNRTVADIRHAFTKFGGNLGADGSVAYIFNHVGVLAYPPGSSEDAIMGAAAEAGAEDILTNEDTSVDVVTDPAEFESVRDAMAQAGFEPESAEITMRAATSMVLGESDAASMIRLLESLEDLDDVQRVYSNADIPDDILARL